MMGMGMENDERWEMGVERDGVEQEIDEEDN